MAVEDVGADVRAQHDAFLKKDIDGINVFAGLTKAVYPVIH
jgi:hypothetical protein